MIYLEIVAKSDNFFCCNRIIFNYEENGNYKFADCNVFSG